MTFLGKAWLPRQADRLSFESQHRTAPIMLSEIFLILCDWQPSGCKWSALVHYNKCAQRPFHLDSTWNKDYENGSIYPICKQTTGGREIKQNPCFCVINWVAGQIYLSNVLWNSTLSPASDLSCLFLLPLKSTGFRKLPSVHTPSAFKTSNSTARQSPLKQNIRFPLLLYW